MTGAATAGVCSLLIFLLSSRFTNAVEDTGIEDALVKKLTAVCGKDGIKVSVRFSQPFRGIIYSDGHYDTPHCIFIDQEKNARFNSLSETIFSFLIPADECGTKFHDPGSALSSQNDNASAQPVNELDNEVFMENTVMFQQNHFIQEQGDLAQTLRCVWQKEIRRPLQATLPLSIRGKHRSKHVPESIREEKKQYVTSALSTAPSFPSSTPLIMRNFTKPYADIIKRFQAKGQVESVSYGSGRRSGKSLTLRDPVAARQLKSDNDVILYRNPSNFTALPFKANGSCEAASFTAVSFYPVILVTLMMHQMPRIFYPSL